MRSKRAWIKTVFSIYSEGITLCAPLYLTALGAASFFFFTRSREDHKGFIPPELTKKSVVFPVAFLVIKIGSRLMIYSILIFNT